MCRSIKRLRTREGDTPPQEVQEAALQFVRKVSGMRHPSQRNAPAFDEAVIEIAQATERLLERLPPLQTRPSDPPV